LVVAGGLLTILAPAAARADPPAFPIDEGVVVGIVAAGALLPSDIGVAIPTANASNANLVLGWSWQLPVSGFVGDHTMHHRVLAAVDLLPHSDGADWRGRFGYRYGRRHLFGGLAIGIDGAGANLSPELGVKFAHAERGDGDDFDASLHLIARAEIAPESGHVRGATVLLGWNLF
jgi:hypothetical protein